MRERLLALLPPNVEPFIFPPIVVAPEEMISDKLLGAVRECDGLIYLKDGASEQSFWVALERDYALRQGKPVFAFDAVSNALIRDTSAPISPMVYMSYSNRDKAAADYTVKALHLRFFDVWFDPGSIYPGDNIAKVIEGAIHQRIQAGGYVIALWSAQAQTSRWVQAELQFSDTLVRDRVLFAQLDDTPMPMTSRGTYMNVVQIYGDEERSQVHRLDDLIVRLYWLIYRNTRQNRLD